jgi:type I restriction enzyme R subunit
LVFYKPVKSFSKFWQMIGRGSRLRPDLFGVGKDKERFLIFDLCENFEFFNENPKGIESSSQKSLSEIVFELKLRLAQYLNQKQFQTDENLAAYRKELLDQLHNSIITLETQRFDVKIRIQTVLDYGANNRELWNHLSKKDEKIIIEQLAPLVQPEKGDTDLARFYDKLLYTIMIKRLETPNTPQFVEALTIPIAKVATTSKRLLKKTTIPEVKYKEGLIKLPLEESFWTNEGIFHLEKIRAGIRDLTKYIDPVDQKYVTTDFQDQLNEEEVVITDYTSNKTQVASPFKSNVHRLEEIIRNHKDNITINRIRNGETITKIELKSLEKILFSDKVKKETIESELGNKLDIVGFIVALMGISAESVDKAFANFINEYQLNATQIQFIDTLKLFLTNNGKLDPSKLYDTPFKNFHSLGVDGVFSEQQTDVIFKIIEDFNQNQTGA